MLIPQQMWKCEGEAAVFQNHRLLRTHPLIVLFFLNLFHLVQQLSHTQLKLCQFIFSGDFWVVIGMFPHLDVKVHPLPWRKTREPCYNVTQ